MRNLMLAVMFGFCATAVAQDLNTIPEAPDAPDVRDMPVVADLGGCILKPDGSVFTVYPAEVTLVGQWCDIALWKGPFSITEYPSFRVTLLRAPEDDGLVQLFARNIASSQNYKGPYIPFKKNQRVLEGEFAEYDDEEHSGGWFDDDPICTWFALQKTNKGDESQTYTITEAVLINENGEEIKSCNVRNGSWKPAPGWVEPDPMMEADVLLTNKGVIGLYDSKVKPGTVHRFTFNSRDPLPEGLTCYVVINDGDGSTYDYPVPAGSTTFVSPDIDDDYLRCYLEYEGTYPMTIHFNKITREVLDLTDVRNTVTQCDVVKRELFSSDGACIGQQMHGLNIIREQMSDGSVRVKKVIK